MEYTQVVFRIPKDLLREIKVLERGTINKFIIEAAKEKINRRRNEKILAAAGLWKDEKYPEFQKPEDVENYINEVRRSAERRFE